MCNTCGCKSAEEFEADDIPAHLAKWKMDYQFTARNGERFDIYNLGDECLKCGFYEYYKRNGIWYCSDCRAKKSGQRNAEEFGAERGDTWNLSIASKTDAAKNGRQPYCNACDRGLQGSSKVYINESNNVVECAECYNELYGAETFEAGNGLGKNQRNLMKMIIQDYQRHSNQYAIVRVKTNSGCDGYTPRMIDSLYRKNMIKYLDNKGNPDIGFKEISLNPYQLSDCPTILVKPTNRALQMNAKDFEAETFEADKYDVCLVCYDRPATTGSYERVVCDECATYRTGIGQSVGYTTVDCGSCGEGDIPAIEMMRCRNCYDSMCSECPGDSAYCISCYEKHGAESFEATKGIDTYAQPIEELKIKPTKTKVGILLASIVAGGLWYSNKMKE